MSDEQYISGIFNYCDRWCERCAFTARCRTFAMEQEFKKAEQEGRDPQEIDWAAFWKRVGLSFDRTPTEWLDEPDDASEPEFDLGITFSESDDDILDAAVDEHPLYLRAFEYAEAAHQWLRRHGKEWSDAPPDRSDTEQGASEGQCGINLSDALAVVSWYHTLIAAKLNRAVRGVLENEQEHPFGHEPDPDDAFGEDDAAFDIYEANAFDAAGSAKVALISIERSIGAWTVIRTARPELADSIAPLQRLLGWLRVQTDRLIPSARTFRRPGFDD